MSGTHIDTRAGVISLRSIADFRYVRAGLTTNHKQVGGVRK
jgi:hypothetical protein